jgi:predicted nuclease of restriction endonuclease-like RecB superfamily
MSLQSPQPLLFTDNYFSESDAGYAGLIEKLSQSIEATKEFSQMISSRFAAEEQYALDVLKVINDYECTETGYDAC